MKSQDGADDKAWEKRGFKETAFDIDIHAMEAAAKTGEGVAIAQGNGLPPNRVRGTPSQTKPIQTRGFVFGSRFAFLETKPRKNKTS